MVIYHGRKFSKPPWSKQKEMGQIIPMGGELGSVGILSSLFHGKKTIDWTFSTFLFIQKKLSSKTGLDFLLLYQCLAGWYEFANQSNHLASRNLIIMQKSPGKNLAKYFTNLDFPQIIAGWWFQPPWKICSSNWIISPWIRGENEKYLSCHHLVHQPRFPWNN